jgi:hypothetical protein
VNVLPWSIGSLIPSDSLCMPGCRLDKSQVAASWQACSVGCPGSPFWTLVLEPSLPVLTLFFGFCLVGFLVLEIELSASHLLSKHSTA